MGYSSLFSVTPKSDFPIKHDCHLCLRERRDEHLPNELSFFVISIVAAILQLFFVVCLGRLRSLPTNKNGFVWASAHMVFSNV